MSKAIRKIMLAAALGAMVPALAFADDHSAETRNVLVFGDSITWGWLPKAPIVPTVRHAEEDRWPSIMQAALGEDYDVVTEGLSGRTTDIEDPEAPGLMNGADYLPAALMSHEPIDLVVIMLGTNDTKTYLERPPLEIGLGMGTLVNIVQEGAGLGWYDYEADAPEVLVISPPPLGEEIDPLAAEIFVGAHEKISALPAIYSAVADAAGAHFFDAASVVDLEEVGVDGVHLEVEGNRDLGEAVAEKVKQILEE